MMKAIVTGHSRGVGAAVAAELLRRDIPTLGLARGGNAQLAARHPDTFRQQALDLTDAMLVAGWLGSSALAAFLADAATVLLINNAGVVHPIGPLGSQDTADIARAVALNVSTPLMLANAVVAASPNADERRILHVSSGAGRNPYPGWSVYCATKAALDLHASAAALDQAPGLRICSVAPGVIDTAMQAEIRASAPDLFPLRDQFEAMKRDGVLATPQACAQRLVDFLLSDEFGVTPVAAVHG